MIDLSIDLEQLGRLYDTGLIQIDLAELAQQASTHFEESSSKFTKKLGNFFSTSESFFQQSKIQFELPNFSPNIQSKIEYRFSAGTALNILFNKPEGSTLLSVALVLDKEQTAFINKSHFIGLFKGVLPNYIKRSLYGHILVSPFSVTSERTGVALFYKELDSNKYEIIEELDAITNESSNLLTLMKDKKSRYAEPIQDNIDIIRDYDQYSKRKSFLLEDKVQYAPVFEALQSMTTGGFRSNSGQVFYRPKKERNKDEVLVPVYLASSSIKSLFLIDYYINNLAKKGQLLVIDEPELNLHPDNQRKMAALIVRLINSSIKILITTHSEYLVREINNRIMLSNVLKNKAELMKKSGFVDMDILKPEQVAAYSLKTDHTIQSMEINRYGINSQIFDEIIADSNQLSDDIYYSIKD